MFYKDLVLIIILFIFMFFSNKDFKILVLEFIFVSLYYSFFILFYFMIVIHDISENFTYEISNHITSTHIHEMRGSGFNPGSSPSDSYIHPSFLEQSYDNNATLNKVKVTMEEDKAYDSEAQATYNHLCQTNESLNNRLAITMVGGGSGGGIVAKVSGTCVEAGMATGTLYGVVFGETSNAIDQILKK